MTDIPVPMIMGLSDSEKITNIISYLSQLVSALERALTSVDFSNLSQELAKRINDSLTKHQDLSAYATTAFVKNQGYATESFVTSQGYVTETKLNNEISSISYFIDEINNKLDNYYVNESDLSSKLKEYATIKYVEEYVDKKL